MLDADRRTRSVFAEEVEKLGKLTERREAKLRPECAAGYPTLPVSIWTSAARIADLVVSIPGQTVGTLKKGRTLLEDHFDFRGGRRRGLAAGWFAHTRMGRCRELLKQLPRSLRSHGMRSLAAYHPTFPSPARPPRFTLKPISIPRIARGSSDDLSHDQRQDPGARRRRRHAAALGPA